MISLPHPKNAKPHLLKFAQSPRIITSGIWRFGFGLWFSAAIGAAVHATELKIEDATVADLNAAFKSGSLTSVKLTELYLARIAAYDKQGPGINAIITLNQSALVEASKLDAERKAGKIRGPLHGIPIVLKDNFNTFDLPTMAGSQMLEGSIPPEDAYVVKKLREAGAIILAKTNLSEFAGGGGSMSGATDPEMIKKGTIPNGFSSMGLQTHNPHDTSRGPSGSSGGSGAGLAAAFAQIGLGTDTGGSVRGPSSANGIVGLKPTHGLMSRNGIVPLSLTFDTGGPMARNVYDVAVALGVMTGVDPADPATKKSAGKFENNYVKYLKTGSLKGARIGVLRGYGKVHPETDRVLSESIETMKKLGAVIVEDVRIPEYVLACRASISTAIRNAEFKVQIEQYLRTLKGNYPKTLDDLVKLSNDPKFGYRSPEKAYALKYSAEMALDLDDPTYLAAKNEGLAMIKAAIDALFTKYALDAMVYPTSPAPAEKIKPDQSDAGPADSITRFANQTGYPDLIVPAGMSNDGLPVTISFFGQAFTEPKLLGYGYDFEQATKARVLPKTTPVLPGETISF